jgi:hypothetical protein
MSNGQTIPCIQLPPGGSFSITLPFGGQLTSVIDLSKGPPTDCTLIHGLMLQLGPALAGIQCILKLLKVVTALTKISPTSLGDIISAATDFVAHCVPLPITFACTILDIIRLLIKYLKCIISAILSILEFKVGIDLNAAKDNPVLLLSLQCAQGNADGSITSLKDALLIIDSLLTLIQPILEAAESVLPDSIKQGLNTISEIKSTLDSIVQAGGVSVGIPGVQDIVQTLQGFQNDLQELDATVTTVAEMLGCA